MAEHEDRRRILDMVAQGKITVDEAEQLLAALAGQTSGTASADATSTTLPRYMRIVVHRPAREAKEHAHYGYSWPGVPRPEKTVSVRIPFSLVRSGMRLGAIVPGTAGEILTNVLRERGINVDMSKMNPEELAAALKELGELSVDVDNGKAQVRISCE
jgi:hypothetical protein